MVLGKPAGTAQDNTVKAMIVGLASACMAVDIPKEFTCDVSDFNGRTPMYIANRFIVVAVVGGSVFLEIGHFRRLQLKLQFVCDKGDKLRIRGFFFGVADGIATKTQLGFRWLILPDGLRF